MRILVTRPQPQADKTADKLVAMGHEVVIEPQLVFEAMAVDPAAVQGYGVLAVTSARAIEALASHGGLDSLQQATVFCVGQATAQAARDVGFCEVVNAQGDVAALNHALVQAQPKERVLYIAGTERSGALEADLCAAGLTCDLLEVYRMAAVQGLSQDTKQLICGGKIDCALFYSPRSLQVFLRNCDLEEATVFLNSVKVLCVSKRVAELAAPFGEVLIADSPNEAALLSLLASQEYDGC